ncbi:hypothetical protein ACFWPV_09770 [Streptomyces uncialis]|uniref:hypothetical protein n=1 Tax=Streptomyces uncialis TaxID=1048205 RepID=UPI00364D3F49
MSSSAQVGVEAALEAFRRRWQQEAERNVLLEARCAELEAQLRASEEARESLEQRHTGGEPGPDGPPGADSGPWFKGAGGPERPDVLAAPALNG